MIQPQRQTKVLEIISGLHVITSDRVTLLTLIRSFVGSAIDMIYLDVRLQDL
jgi:hypothetical protein